MSATLKQHVCMFFLLLRTIFAVGPCDSSGVITNCQCLPIVSGSEVTRCKWDRPAAGADKCKPVTKALINGQKKWRIKNMQGSTGVCSGVTDLITTGLQFQPTNAPWQVLEQKGLTIDDLVEDWTSIPTEHALWYVSFDNFHEFVLERNPEKEEGKQNTLIQGYIGKYNVQWWAGPLLEAEAQKPHRAHWPFWNHKHAPTDSAGAIVAAVTTKMTATQKKYLQPTQRAMNELARNMKDFITIPYTWDSDERPPEGILTEEQDVKMMELFMEYTIDQYESDAAHHDEIRAKFLEAFPDMENRIELDTFFSKLHVPTKEQCDRQQAKIQAAWEKLPFDPANKLAVPDNGIKTNRVHPPRAMKISKWTFDEGDGAPPQNVALETLTASMDFIAANGGWMREWKILPQCYRLQHEFTARTPREDYDSERSRFLKAPDHDRDQFRKKSAAARDQFLAQQGRSRPLIGAQRSFTGKSPESFGLSGSFGGLPPADRTVAASVPESTSSVRTAMMVVIPVFVFCAARFVAQMTTRKLQSDPLLQDHEI